MLASTAPTPLIARAQEESSVITIAPLFDYPVPPEEMQGLRERSEWIMQHFWNPMDLKTKKTVDQNALNHAFGVYVTGMRWASKESVDASVSELIDRLDKNPPLMVQFTKAAEECLYGPRAEIWIDEVYVKFLRGAVASKKMDKARKERYADQLRRVESTMVGSKAPEFDFIRPDGSKATYRPMSTPTIIEFGEPGCVDCRLSRLRLEMNTTLSRLIDQGKVNMMFIIPDDPEDGWQKLLADYPSKWVTGSASEIDDIYDLRGTPSFYVIGQHGKIEAKNVTADAAIKMISEIAEPRTAN